MATGLPAGTKLGRYEVVKHLARGGMADLSIARATGIENFERHVVIKHLRPEQSGDASFVQMFVTEARLAGVLHHHNIVQVHDIGQSDGRHFFAMEYVHGEDLRQLLAKLCDRGEHLPIQHVVTIATAVCAALHHAHEQKGTDRKPLGIVHRDVTPANVLVGYDGNVKVVDFGIAKAALRTSDTGAGMLKGKVPYMAPEQCTGKPVDRRSDVFAFGVVLYELVTVRRLFKGANEYLTMAAVVSGEIPKPSTHRKDLPVELENIILKALSRDPARRFQTADEMRLALDRFADQAGLRTSTTALADYMKQLFGERPEPWMIDISPAVVGSVDFDKTDTGIVEIPADAALEIDVPRAAAASSGNGGTLLDQVRRQATPVVTIPSLTKRKTPPPVVPAKRPANPDTEPVQVAPVIPAEPIPAEPIPAELVSPAEPVIAPEPAATPAAAAPPPVTITTIEPRPAAATTRGLDDVDAARESTEIVKPLEIPPGDLTTMTRAPAADHKWLYLGGLAVAAIGIAIAIMLTGRSVDHPKSPPPEAVNTEPVVAPPNVETKPVKPVETKPVETTPVETKPVETTPDETRPDETKPDETKPDETKPLVETKRLVETKPPVKPPVKKPVVRKPPARPPAKPVKKPPAKPQWDPDTLFLPKK